MTHSIETIEQVEDKRLKALVASDFATIDRLLSDKLVFVHPTSKVDSKASYIATIKARNPYVKIDVVEQTILIHGDVAVVTGEQRILALRDPPEPNATVRTRIICVWAHEERDWQVVRYQATFIR